MGAYESVNKEDPLRYMYSYKKTKKDIFLFLLIIIIFIVFVFLVVFTIAGGVNISNQQITNNESGSQVDNEVFDEVIQVPQDDNPMVIEDRRRLGLINNLPSGLPYEGKGFLLTYDMASDVFTLLLSPENPNEGVAEFEEYLRSNNIENSTWFFNLYTEYENSTL